MISYAQNLEDVVLNRVFRNKPTGFYIDVGAHDPVELSVTKFFYDLGWRGINIEPVPASFRNFEAQRPRDINLNLGLADRHDFMTLYEIEGHPELTTLDLEVASNTSKIVGSGIKEYQIEVRTLAEVCEMYNINFIDFIKIDVEGREKDVIVGADFEKYRPTMLVVEATVPCGAIVEDWTKADENANWHNWEPLLFEAGYLLVYYDGLNRYYLRQEDEHLKSCFSIPMTALQDGFTFYRDVEKQQRLAGEAEDLKERLGQLDQTRQHLDAEKQRLAGQLTTLGEEKQRLEAEKQHLAGEAEDLKERLGQLGQTRQHLDAEKQHLTSQLAALNTEKTHLKKEKRRLQSQVRYRTKKQTEQQHKAALLEEENARLSGRLDALAATRRQLDETLAQAHALNSEFSNKVGTLEEAAQRLREEKRHLQIQSITAQNNLHVLRATLIEEHFLAQRRLLRRLLRPFRSSLRRTLKAAAESPFAKSELPRTAREPSLPARAEQETLPRPLPATPPEPENVDGMTGTDRQETEPIAVNGSLEAVQPALATPQDIDDLLEMHREIGETYRLALDKKREALNESPLVTAGRRQLDKGGVFRLLRPVGKQAYHLVKRSLGENNGSTPPAPPVKEGSHAALNTPLIQALIETRSLPGDVPEQALISLYERGADLQCVLSLQGTPNHLQALHMLSRAGVKSTCLGCNPIPEEQTDDRTTSQAHLAEWLITQGPAALAEYDGLLLDTNLDDDTLTLLKSRLWPHTRLMVIGRDVAADTAQLPSAWGPASCVVDGLAVYDEPPPDWLDPAQGHPTHYDLHQWPATAKQLTLPPTLPSGRPWPKISVVTVTLNQGAYLEETIQSVLGQGYPNLEYIVIDGGSTDNTPAILDRYRPELTYCVSEPDEGQSDALNKGFRQATGELLAWLNSDDKYPPGALMRAALTFDTYATDVVAGGCMLFRGTEKQPLHTHHNAMPVGRVVPLPLHRLLDLDGAWLKGDFFYQPEVFWTRALWERCGGQVDRDLFYSMDYDLWVRMAHQGAKIIHIPETLTLFRMHESQKTSGADLPYLPELRRVNEVLRERLEVL